MKRICAKKPPVLIIALALAAALAASAALAHAEIVQKGNLRIKVPRTGAAPISVTVGGVISTTDKSLPSQLGAHPDRAQPPRAP